MLCLRIAIRVFPEHLRDYFRASEHVMAVRLREWIYRKTRGTCAERKRERERERERDTRNVHVPVVCARSGVIFMARP